MPIARPSLLVKATALLVGWGFALSAQALSVTYTYDLQGRITTALYDNGTCISYSYDPSGNRTSQINTNLGAPGTAAWGTGTWGCFYWSPTATPASTSTANPANTASGGSAQEHGK